MRVSQIYDNQSPAYMYISFNSGEQYDVYSYTSKNYGIRQRAQTKTARKAQKLGINQLIDKIKLLCDASELKIIQSKLKPILIKLGKSGDRTRQRSLNWRTYDLWKEIEKHEFTKAGNPSAKALDWYRKTISPNNEYHFRAMMMRIGVMYTFNYDTPKYMDVLDYYDTQPLIVSLGPINTSLGKRDMGINMHLYPPRIRRIILYKIFEIYRGLYKDQLFAKNQKEINITWQAIAKPLEKYGIAFGIRVYIPELRRNVIEFKYEDWSSAIYLPTKKLAKITQAKLEQKWAEFVKKQNESNGKAKGLNESWSRS